MRSVARTAHLVVAWLLVAGLVVQIFLAGLGVFRDAASFETHKNFGYTLELLPLILLVLGLIAGLGRRAAGLAAAIFGLFLLQSVFVELRTDAARGRRAPPGQRLPHHAPCDRARSRRVARASGVGRGRGRARKPCSRSFGNVGPRRRWPLEIRLASIIA